MIYTPAHLDTVGMMAAERQGRFLAEAEHEQELSQLTQFRNRGPMWSWVVATLSQIIEAWTTRR